MEAQTRTAHTATEPADYPVEFADFPLLTAPQERDADLRKWAAARTCARLLASDKQGRELLALLCESCLQRPPSPDNFPSRAAFYHLRKDIAGMLPGKPGATVLEELLPQLRSDNSIAAVVDSLHSAGWPATLVIGLATIRLRQLGLDYRDKMADVLLTWFSPSPHSDGRRNSHIAHDLSHAVMRYLANRDRLVLHNVRLVYRLAHDNRHRDIPLGDLVQEGCAGLVRAAEKYDYRLGYRFSTYAFNWINQYIQRACQGNGNLLTYPAHVHQDINRLYKLRMQTLEKTGSEPEAEDLAEDAGMALDKVRALRRLNNITVSLDQPISDRMDLSWADTLADKSPEDSTRASEDILLPRLLAARLDSLEEQERFIISGRFGLHGGEPLTFRELADQLSISTEWARQLEKSALAKLSEDASLAQAYSFI